LFAIAISATPKRYKRRKRGVAFETGSESNPVGGEVRGDRRADFTSVDCGELGTHTGKPNN